MSSLRRRTWLLWIVHCHPYSDTPCGVSTQGWSHFLSPGDEMMVMWKSCLLFRYFAELVEVPQCNFGFTWDVSHVSWLANNYYWQGLPTLYTIKNINPSWYWWQIGYEWKFSQSFTYILDVIAIAWGCHKWPPDCQSLTVVLGWYWNWFSTEIVLLGCVLWPPASTGYYLAWYHLKLCEVGTEAQFQAVCSQRSSVSDHCHIRPSELAKFAEHCLLSGSLFASAFVHQGVLHQSLHLWYLIYLSVHRWWLLLLHFCSCGLSSQLVGP